MSAEKKECANCAGMGNVVLPTGRSVECVACDGTGEDLMHHLAVVTKAAQERARQIDEIVERERAAVEREYGDELPDDEKALAVQARVSLALNDPRQPTTAAQLAQPGDPYLVPRTTPNEEQLAQIDEHALATAFHEMSRFPPPPPPDSTTRQREAIGRALAEYLTNAKDGEHADLVAARACAALGSVECHEVADMLARWSLAFANYAHKMERMGLRRR